MGVAAAAIPAELKARPQWVLWRMVTRDGKPTKVPYTTAVDENGPVPAKANDATTWAAWETVWTRFTAGGYDGIGYVFAAEDPYTGVDLDHCRDPQTGTLEPWAQTILGQLQSYTEVTPSGAGLHVLIRGQLPAGGRKHGPLEVYDQRRFFTVTGRRLGEDPVPIAARQPELAALLAAHFPAPPVAEAPPPSDRPVLSDTQVLLRATNAKNGTKLRALLEGDWAGYGSHSEADLALCSLLAFWTGDAGQLDRLFRQSGLMRPKWDEVHYAHGETIGEHTVARVLGAVTAWYHPQTQPEPPEGAGGVRRFQFLTATELKQRPPPVWLVPDYLPAAALGVLDGAPGSFKSFLALDLALSLAAGGEWLERALTAGVTAYVSAEGSGGLGLRIRAWEIARHTVAPDQAYFLTAAPQLLQAGDVRELLQELQVLPTAPVLVVFDTLSRVMTGGDENTQKDMTVLVEAAEQVRRATGAAVLFIHHTNKGAGTIRGSSVLPGAVDVQLELRRNTQELVTLSCEKMKDGVEFEPVALHRRVVELDATRELTSVVLEAAGQGAVATDLAKKAGAVLVPFGTAGASATEWQMAFEEAGHGKKSTFHRAREAALKAKLAVHGGDKRYRVPAEVPGTPGTCTFVLPDGGPMSPWDLSPTDDDEGNSGKETEVPGTNLGLSGTQPPTEGPKVPDPYPKEGSGPVGTEGHDVDQKIDEVAGGDHALMHPCAGCGKLVPPTWTTCTACEEPLPTTFDVASAGDVAQIHADAATLGTTPEAAALAQKKRNATKAKK